MYLLFDSYGTEPPERVNQFVSEVIRQGSEINIPFCIRTMINNINRVVVNVVFIAYIF